MNNEEPYIKVFENMAEGVAIHEMIYDSSGRPVDYRILNVNAAYEKNTGIPSQKAVGSLASELYGTNPPPYLDEFASVALEERPLTFETYSPKISRTFGISAFSQKKDQFVTLFRDISEEKKLLEKLQEKERDMDEAERVAGLGSWTAMGTSADLSQSKIFWSKNLLVLFGFKVSDPVPDLKQILEMCEPSDAKKYVEAITRSRDSGTPFETELELKNDLAKNMKWLISRGEPVKNSKGEYIGMRGTVQDITERKGLEEKRKIVETELEEAQRMAKIGNFMALGEEPASLKESIWSEEINRIINRSGSSSPTLQEQIELFPPEASKIFVEAVSELFKTGKSYDLELPLKEQEGRKAKWIESCAEPVYDENKKIVGLRGTVQDITERKDAEKAIKENEATYQSILKASPDAIKIADLEGNIELVSPSALKMFGFEKEEELRGRKITDFLDPSDRERATEATRSMFKGERPGPMIFHGLKRDGTMFDIEANAEFIYDAGGNPQKLVLIIRDITSRKQTDAALKATQSELADKVADLEKFVKLTTGRELKMVELKQQVAELEQKLAANTLKN